MSSLYMCLTSDFIIIAPRGLVSAILSFCIGYIRRLTCLAALYTLMFSGLLPGKIDSIDGLVRIYYFPMILFDEIILLLLCPDFV